MPNAGRRLLVACIALGACSGGVGDRPASAASTAEVSGLASWYGDDLAGRPTASGERFDPARITAAHRTLPLGSVAEVTDLSTGRAVLVRINDRGPGHRDRLIDLSRGAARLLGTDRHAVARVRVRPVRAGREGVVTAIGARPFALAAAAPPSALPSGRYRVQVASFVDRDRARALANLLQADMVPAPTGWRVRLGPFAAASAQRARDAVAARGYADAQILATD